MSEADQDYHDVYKPSTFILLPFVLSDSTNDSTSGYIENDDRDNFSLKFAKRCNFNQAQTDQLYTLVHRSIGFLLSRASDFSGLK